MKSGCSADVGQCGDNTESGTQRVMPKRLKSGSGHHRLEICGPSNGRHKTA